MGEHGGRGRTIVGNLLWGGSLASPGVGVLDGLHALTLNEVKGKAMQPFKSRG
jgi:hypothetical protein